MAAARTDGAQAGAQPFNTTVERDGNGWAVIMPFDGRRNVVSRHPNRELAEQAAASLNASGNLEDAFTAHDVLPGADGRFDA